MSRSRAQLAHDRPDLFRRSDALGLWRLFGPLSLLATTAAALTCCITTTSATISCCWPLALLVHSVTLTHLYMPFHESTHGTAFESVRLCRCVAWSIGCVIGMNADSFQWFHREHHEQTQVHGRDPELPGANGFLRNYLNKLLGGEMATALYHFARSTVLGEVAEGPWVPKHARRGVVTSTRIQSALYAVCVALALASPSIRWWLVQLWLLPLLVGQPALWGHFIAQHTATDHDTDPRHTARVVLTHPAYEWLSWGMNYHAVHHMHPRIPFHQLPRAFAAASGEFKHVEDRGYLYAHATLIKAALAGAAARRTSSSQKC